MKLIKIVTEEKSLVKPHMTKIMSFDEGIIEIIVGWELAKKSGATILNHKINEKTYWTFSPREKRKVFEEQIKSFVFEGIQGLIKGVKINNLNPLEYKDQKEYLEKLKNSISGCDGYLYLSKIYVYCGEEIYHIDLDLLKFLSWNMIEEIENLLNIKQNPEIPKVLKGLDIKYIPYLNAKKSNIISDICNP